MRYNFFDAGYNSMNMKYLLLFIAVFSGSISSFAQVGHRMRVTVQSENVFAERNLTDMSIATGIPSVANKQTAYGDTLYMSHIAPTDTITLYYVAHDSGFAAGMNAYGDEGFAERYDFVSSDSAVKVIGVISRFGGHVNPLSSRSVTFNVWAPAAKTVSDRPTLHNSGLPGSVMASTTVKLTQLGVSAIDTVADSARVFMFPMATPYLSAHFFVGYTISYAWSNMLAGDTVGLYSNQDGERTAPSFTVASTDDTIINNVNVTQYADHKWHDNAVDNFGISNNLYIFPVVLIGESLTSAVKGITRSDLTLYGAYPNPAANNTAIKFTIAGNTDVTIELMDLSGRTVSTVKQSSLTAGEHTIPLQTGTLAAGDYIYLIRTGNGGGMASKLTIVK